MSAATATPAQTPAHKKCPNCNFNGDPAREGFCCVTCKGVKGQHGADCGRVPHKKQKQGFQGLKARRAAARAHQGKEAEEALAKMDIDKAHLAALIKAEVKEMSAWRKFKNQLMDQRSEMLAYFLFLIVLTITMMYTKNQKYDYQFVTQVKGFLLEGEFAKEVTHIKKTFYDIGGEDDFFGFMTTVFLPNVFERYPRTYCFWQNETGTCEGSGFILGFNALLGPVRMRQVRRKLVPCLTDSDFIDAYFNGTCIGQHEDREGGAIFERFNEFKEDDKVFDKTPKQLDEQGQQGWRFRTAKMNRVYEEQHGWIERYDGSGYVVDFERAVSSDEHIATLNNLRENGWVDAATAAIIIDFSLYNPTVNIFQVLTLYVELLPVGGAYPYADVQSARLFRWPDSNLGIAQGIFDCMLLVLVFGFLILELLELFHYCNGATCIDWHYFEDFWNVLDLSVMMLFVLGYALTFYAVFGFESEFADWDVADNAHFVPTRHYAELWLDGNNIFAVNSFLVWFKVLKYTAFVPGLSLVTQTLARSARATVFFVMLFALVLIGFAFFGYISFGDKLEEYQSFWQSMASLLLGLLGGMDYASLYVSDRALGPFFFFLFTVLSIFVLLSMFFAILSEAYEAVKEENAASKIDISKQLQRDIGSWYNNHFQKAKLGQPPAIVFHEEEEEPVVLLKEDVNKIFKANYAQIDYVYNKKHKGKFPNVKTVDDWIKVVIEDAVKVRQRKKGKKPEAAGSSADDVHFTKADVQAAVEVLLAPSRKSAGEKVYGEFMGKFDKAIQQRLPSSESDEEDQIARVEHKIRGVRRHLRLIEQRLGIEKPPKGHGKFAVAPIDGFEDGKLMQYSGSDKDDQEDYDDASAGSEPEESGSEEESA